ncbi:hypothetical protein GGR72_001501 [Xanthomonas arboricola]|nr:hypothetical protein [Xanthomonas arboricola]
MKKRFSEEQIIGFPREPEAGVAWVSMLYLARAAALD